MENPQYPESSECLYLTSLNRQWGLLLANESRRWVLWFMLNQRSGLANFSRSNLCRGAVLGYFLHTLSRSAHGRGKACHPSEPPPGRRVCHFPVALRQFSLTWPCQRQQHTFTQGFLHPPQFPQPTGFTMNNHRIPRAEGTTISDQAICTLHLMLSWYYI